MKNLQKYIDLLFVTIFCLGLLFQIYLWSGIVAGDVEIARQYIWAYSTYILIPMVPIAILYLLYTLLLFAGKYWKESTPFKQKTTRASLYLFIITLASIGIFEIYISIIL